MTLKFQLNFYFIPFSSSRDMIFCYKLVFAFCIRRVWFCLIFSSCRIFSSTASSCSVSLRMTDDFFPRSAIYWRMPAAWTSESFYWFRSLLPSSLKFSSRFLSVFIYNFPSFKRLFLRFNSSSKFCSSC